VGAKQARHTLRSSANQGARDLDANSTAPLAHSAHTRSGTVGDILKLKKRKKSTVR
jgi:hypothetical protein